MAVSITNTATDNALNIIGTNSGTISGAAIGTEAADRLVFVHISNVDGNSAGAMVTGVTIGGVAATVKANINDGTFFQSVIYYALVPTGTTANIVITVANSSGDCYLCTSVFRVVGANTTTPVTSSNTDDGSADSLPSCAVTVGAGGALLAGACAMTLGAASFSGWTNATSASNVQRTIVSYSNDEQTATSTSTGSITVTADYTAGFPVGGPFMSLVAIDAAAGDTLTNQTLRFM